MQVAKEASPSRKIAKLDFAPIFSSPALWPALIITLGLSAIFWGLFRFTYHKWTEPDGYYSHGFLVPFISGYIVFRWWPKLKNIPAKPGWLGLPFLLFMLWFSYAAGRTDIYSLLSISLVVCMILSIWVIAGWRWMVALLAPCAYLLFALPVWDQVINAYTNPLQLMSTKIAFHMMQAFGMHPQMPDSTHIALNSYVLEVAVACSGFKTLLALLAFGAFFILIAKLKTWANIVFAASIVPIALFMNGLRIALVGVVGNAWGINAGKSFHDYSGYIMIILCFLLLDRWAKLLGWKRDAELAPVIDTKAQSAVINPHLKWRAFAVGGLFLAGGAAVLAAPKPVAPPNRTEAWMEKVAPSHIGDYKVQSTYKMDPSTYQELQPYGIVCRILGNGKESFDVTLLASNRKTSFHDPRVCFPAQGWSFDDQQVVNVPTATRGVIPMTIIHMTGEDHSEQLAGYFYRGPKGFFASPQALSFSMLKDQFLGRQDEGVFYRFMPQYNGATRDQLIKFVGKYMDESPKLSGGFF